MESWAHCLGSSIFSCSRGNCTFFFQFPFWYFGIVQIWSMYHSLETRIWSLIIFSPPKESLTLFQIWFFLLTFNYFVPFGVIENLSIYRELTSSILMEIATIPVVFVHEFYFCMRHPIKAWLFGKIIFQLVYLFYIVLKPLMFY